MRTITENFLYRLVAQAEEAEIQGLTKIAESLTDQVEKHGLHVRADDAFYSYNEDDFKKEINSQFWDSIVRIADFYGVKKFDALEVQGLIEQASENLITDLCKKVGVFHGIGAYEESVPGEKVERVAIEVEEGL